jgi:hypothetical protein
LAKRTPKPYQADERKRAKRKKWSGQVGVGTSDENLLLAVRSQLKSLTFLLFDLISLGCLLLEKEAELALCDLPLLGGGLKRICATPTRNKKERAFLPFFLLFSLSFI